MTRRPDGPAILGLLILAGVLSVGALALIGMGREVPAEVWALVAGAIGAVGGWVGKTMTTEPVPAPVVVDVAPAAEVAQAETVIPLPTSTPAVYPLPDDRLGPATAATHPAPAASPAELAARSSGVPA